MKVRLYDTANRCLGMPPKNMVITPHEISTNDEYDVIVKRSLDMAEGFIDPKPIVYAVVRPDFDKTEVAKCDSTIWRRVVKLETDEKNETCFQPLAAFLSQEIEPLNNNGLYKSEVAMERLEYDRVEEKAVLGMTGVHQEFLPNTVYASETKLRSDLEASKKAGQILKWSCLLVDDHIGVSSFQERGGGSLGSSFNKEVIIRRLLSDLGMKIHLDCVSSLEDAGQKLAERQYDAILLDYLLGEKKCEEPAGKYREQGVDLIKWLNGELDPGNRWQPKREPLQPFLARRYWIFPVSVFPQAFPKLVATGKIQTIGKKCFISAGADPICTPHLFRFQLYQFLSSIAEKVLEGSTTTPAEAVWFKWLSEEMEKLFGKFAESAVTVQMDAVEARLRVLQHLANFRDLSSACKREQTYGGLASHLTERQDPANAYHLVFNFLNGVASQTASWRELSLILDNIRSELRDRSEQEKWIQSAVAYLAELKNHQSA
jgi:hypothetical protein